MFGPCKACAAQQRHILDLQDEIHSLRKLVYSPTNPDVLPSLVVEANAIMDGAQQDIIMTNEELEAEADALLTANY